MYSQELLQKIHAKRERKALDIIETRRKGNDLDILWRCIQKHCNP